MNGPHTLDQLLEIRKAFEANTSQNGASPFVEVGSSGSTLSMQSLDKTFVAIVSTDRDFRFLKNTPKRQINQVLAEYNKNRSHGGGWYNTSYIGQSDEPSFRDSEIQRLYDEVNYVAEGFAFNKVVDTVANVQDPEIIQSNSALRRGMENMMRSYWFGSKSINKFNQDGFATKISNLGSDFVKDARGQLPSADEIKEYTSKIRTKYFGLANQLWMHNTTKALYDQIYDFAGQAKVLQNNNQGPNSVGLGNIVPHIWDSNGANNMITLEDDIWLDRHDWEVPKRLDSNGNLVEGPTSDTDSPETPAIALAAIPSITGSKFDVSYSGEYKYRACAGNLRHWSAASPIETETVNTGGGVEITLTPGNSGPPTTRFAVFRETTPGSGIIRYMVEIVRNTSGPTTVFQDLNFDLPGTTIMVLGDFNSQSATDESRTFILSELLGFTKSLFPYGAGGRLRLRQGIIEHYGVLQILAPEKFRVFKNVPVKR
ncbi:capsid protein [Leptospira andrefontaineae]|uniref:Capsid protein n=1 Tax=Leptospira andrefontaineae TaxID=2484976 RepID=A0A4R9H6T6_9LEPT|nr:capsid protein [Leptospira andrefontaineae]TGK41227.1 capsid protein [Leptospira andrefontaineae]